MNATIAVMTREVMARRELFLLAVAVAVIVSLLPFLPMVESYEATDVRTVGSSAVALALGSILALLLGATIFGNDLSEGRLGFYFARPLSGFALWWGRVLAVMALVWIVEIIVLAPALYGQGIDIFTSSDSVDWLTILGYVIAPLLLFLLAHAVSVMVRARTAWLFLDLVGLIVFAVFVWVNLRPFLAMFAQIALLVIAGALVVSLMIALAVAGGVGVAVGRVDLRRTHGALSLALWGTLFLWVAAVTLYSGWLRDFGPAEFDDVEVMTVAPDGQWVEVIGRTKGRLDVSRRCLISTTDNRWLLLPSQSWANWNDVAYSRDGSTALWKGAGLGDEPRALWWADLGRSDPSARPTNIVVPQGAVQILSADGSRIALLEEMTLSIYEREDERLVSAVRLPGDFGRTAVFFPSRDTLRIFARNEDGDGHSLLLAEVDAATGEIARIGEIEEIVEESWIAVDGDWQRFVMWTRNQPGQMPIKSIYDASDGKLIKNFSTPGFPRILRDGRIVILAEGENAETRLIVESVEDDERIVHEMDGANELSLSGEAVPNGVVLSRLADPLDRTQGRNIELLDVDTGQVRTIGLNLRRGFPWFPWHSGTVGVVFWYNDQPAACRFFIDQSGALVRWDPESGDMVHIVGGRD